VVQERTYIAWSCLCCNERGPGNPTVMPTLDQHHVECVESRKDSDPDAVSALKSKLARACTLYNREMHLAIDAKLAAEEQQNELATLRTAKVVMQNAVHCPQCNSAATDVVEQLPDHDIFVFRCQKCAAEFRA
jgi:hypothetical protein